MATTKATELGQLGSKLTIHNEDITLDGNVHGQYAGFDSDFTNALSSNISVTGNISVSGTVDGRDVATDGTKLDGIEAAATADQTKSDIEGLGIDVPATNLTGTIPAARLSTATTQAESDDSTKIATTAYVVDKITTLIGGAPSTLNDLNELAAAINDDANYNSTLTTALATKLPKAGGTMTGNINFGDNNKVIFGASSDLQIYHDGSNSIIKDAGAGNLQINAGSFVVNNAANNANIIVGNDGGAVQLYDNGSEKLATTSTGIDVTGTVTADGLTVDNVDINGVTVAWQNGGTNQTYFSTTGSSEQALILRLDNQNLSSTGYFEIQDGSAGRKLLKVADNGDIRFYEDTGTATKFFWDASAERLGLGTSSPSRQLEIYDDGTVGQAVLALTAQNTDYSRIMFADPDDSNIGILDYAHSDNSMRFTVNNEVRMRIDSSGNLLVGKTSAGYNVDGFEARQNGETYVSRSGTPMAINRNSSNGTALNFYKDGAGVGDIGSDNGRLYIQSSGGANLAGIGFSRTAVAVEPRKNNAFSSAEVDIGSATYKFRDVYLSGGIQFDSRSNKLDDYEEGTWTPSILVENAAAASITVNHASYTKIGRLVSLVFDVTINSVTGTNSSRAIQLEGMPFTINTASGGGPNIAYTNLTNSMTGSLALQGRFNTRYRIVNLNGATGLNASDHLQANTVLRGQFTYHTDQ